MSAHSITSRGLAGRKIPQGTLTPIGALLFAASEPGAWYDPSDTSTLFQDSAGATPVTAVEQQVGRMLDKSGRGNHATQVTATKRPVYSRRVNMFQNTEFSLGFSGYPIRDGAIGLTSMGGYGGAVSFGNTTSSYVYTDMTFIAGAKYVISAVVEMDDGLPPQFNSENPSSDLVDFAFVHGGNAESPKKITATHLDGSRYMVSMPITTVNAGGNTGIVKYDSNSARTFKVTAYSLVRASDASLPYQRVTTATDYDADPAKFPAYLRFDGVDDGLQTENIDFTGTDKMTAWAGVTKLSDAVRSCVVEFGNGSVDTSSIMYLNAPGWTPSTDKFSFAAVATAAGASVATATGSDLDAPINTVVCGFYTPGETSKLRINSVQRAAAGTANPAGNFVSRPLFIGARAGTSLYFNGRLYSLIVRGAQTPLSQIEATELYIKQKMRMP